MADKNIQMTQRNAANTEWDNIFPVTKAENVKTASGSNVETDLANLAKLKARDARSEGAKTPKWYVDNGYVSGQYIELNYMSNVGLPGSNLCHVITSFPWRDISGGVFQTIIDTSTAIIYTRRSTSETTWDTHKKILNIDDYNALFQYANDGKTAVANAVTARGVAASPSDTFSVLATKIGQIKRQASGTVTAVYINGKYRLQVSGLAFTPSVIIAMHTGSVNQEYAMYWPANGLYYNGTRYLSWAVHSGTFVYTNSDFIVTASSFDIICAYSGNYNWIAFE